MSAFALVVSDTSPLITLAKADQLDLLLSLHAPIEVPDVVFFEATRAGFDDGKRLVDWSNRHSGQVRIAPTSRLREWMILTEAGERAKEFSELAAIETVEIFAASHPGGRVLLLYEDSDLTRYRIAGAPELVTTGTLLLELERAGRIQSAHHILDEAVAAARNLEQQRTQPGHDRLRDALRGTGAH